MTSLESNKIYRPLVYIRKNEKRKKRQKAQKDTFSEAEKCAFIPFVFGETERSVVSTARMCVWFMFFYPTQPYKHNYCWIVVVVWVSPYDQRELMNSGSNIMMKKTTKGKFDLCVCKFESTESGNREGAQP